MNNKLGPRVARSFAERVGSRRPVSFEHGLDDHPLFTIDAIAELAERLGAESISAENAAKPLVTAQPAFLDLATETIAERIRTLAATDSWFTLLNIESDPPYGHLVDRILDDVADDGGLAREELRRRMGFVFASSPGSVTPVHFDVEHSLLMQVRGHRTLCFGRFRSSADREHEVRRYWTGTSYGRLEVMPEPTEEYELTPGTGAYIPPYTPHWLRNGPTPSTSLTVTFYERSNEEETRVQVLNERLRRWGLRPAPYGASPALDRLKAAAMGWQAAVRGRRDDVSSSRSH